MTDLTDYFLLPVPVSAAAWNRLHLDPLLAEDVPQDSYYRLQLVAEQMRRSNNDVSAGQLQLLGLLCRVFRQLCSNALQSSDVSAQPSFDRPLKHFVELYPPQKIQQGETGREFLYGPQSLRNRRLTMTELFILAAQCENPAASPMRTLFSDEELQHRCDYRQLLSGIGPGAPNGAKPAALLDMLLEPIRQAPQSLDAQLRWVSSQWGDLLPSELLREIPAGLSIAAAEFEQPSGATGEPLPPGRGDEDEPEAFSQDAGWMAEVVLIAKSTHVWLNQLSRRYGHDIQRLDQIPDAELDQLADAGFSALWLIGLWERSPASSKLKQLRGNHEAKASAYALYDYTIAWELGGEEAFWQLSERCGERGIRLCGDVVPNHTGLHSRWIKEHPDWYIQLDHPPFAAYRFNGPDLSNDPELELTIDDGYFDHSDAAVVFRHHDHRDGRTRFIYHGNDGTHMPWNDTAQLNYLLPEVREAMIQTIIDVAKRFPLIRFDAAMTLAKKHFQRLWYPVPGGGAGVPSRALHALSQEEFERLFPVEFWREVVDRVAAEVPDTLLLAEAFWLLEGYFVRTLGMHRVYNSAFMNMLKREDNAKYRQVIKETLEFNPQILQRFVNFMNNPDEATAVEQFGKGDKYFGVSVLLATLPGLPLFGHGQIEGLREKYGMEYARPQLDEEIDQPFLDHHRSQVFPLLRRRALFSHADNFALYDCFNGSTVNENVFAFSNAYRGQRALIVFNNSPQPTQGWIRLAAAKRQGGEQGELLQSSLGQGLQLQNEEDTFYRCRELCGGTEMLLRGTDIHQQGLQVELGPYGYRVLIDFEEIRDSDGSWQQLWQQLGHAPCSDLDRRLLRVRHKELLSAWAHLEQRWAADSSKEDDDSAQLLTDYYRQLGHIGPGLRDPDLAARAAEQRLLAWQKLAAEASAITDAEDDVLRCWLYWSAAIDPACDREMVIHLGNQLGQLQEANAPSGITELARFSALLLRLTHLDPQELIDHLGRYLFGDDDILAWLGSNRWQEVDYINQEQLDRFLSLLPLCCRLQAVDLDECDKASLAQIDKACNRLAVEAENCGYQLEILTDLA